jgi:hypothetical protein
VLILYAFVVPYCLSTLNPLKNVALVQPEGLNPEPKVLCYKSRTSRGVWWSGVRCIYFILAVTFGFWAVVLESFYQQPIFGEMGQKMSDCTKPGLISSNGAGSTNGRPLIWIRKNIFFLLAPCYSLFWCNTGGNIKSTSHCSRKNIGDGCIPKAQAFYATMECQNPGVATTPLSRNAIQGLECHLPLWIYWVPLLVLVDSVSTIFWDLRPVCASHGWATSWPTSMWKLIRTYIWWRFACALAEVGIKSGTVMSLALKCMSCQAFKRLRPHRGIPHGGWSWEPTDSMCPKCSV